MNRLPSADLGFTHFLTQADAVGLALLAALVLMSVASWTVIFGRMRRALIAARHDRAFLAALDALPQADAWHACCARHADRSPLARLALAGLDDTPGGAAPSSARDALALAVQQALDREVAALEIGQTMLASVASGAPFVGLFGTVWGIHHALLAIAASGQSSLDQVAGPIGEALIMTACGLAVAIPAGLAYNAFQRAIRLKTATLEHFSADLLLRGRPLSQTLR